MPSIFRLVIISKIDVEFIFPILGDYVGVPVPAPTPDSQPFDSSQSFDQADDSLGSLEKLLNLLTQA